MNPKISAVIFTAVLAGLGLFSSAPKSDPVEASRLNNIGVAYMNQQLFEKALKEFQQAQATDPKFSIARLNEGVAYLNLQKIDEAKAALDDAIKQDPKNPNAWYSLGLLAKNTGDAPAAIDAFKRVTEIDPDNADTWYFLGTSYAQAKQFPQAIEAFDHAIKINPLHASAEFGLSRAYQQSGDTEHAREHLKRFQYITQNKYGAPMSLAYGEQGQYSRAVESPLMPLKPPPQIKVQFVDVTKEAGLVTKSNSTGYSGRMERSLGSGACFLDYDAHGEIDILLADEGPMSGLALYRNLGNGKFEDVTKKAGLDPTLHAVGCAAGDYDNDGATDLVVITTAEVKIFHNEKNGIFKDVSQPAGIKSEGNNIGATFVDYDHDGDLDLYITRGKPSPASAVRPAFESDWSGNIMFRNNGDGKFTDVTEQTGLKGAGPYVTAIGTDYNNDRAVDLLASIARLNAPPPAKPNAMVYLNRKEGRFADLYPFTGDDGVVPKSGIAVLDFDHDGWMDAALTAEGVPSLTLWRNDQGKSFQRKAFPIPDWSAAFGVAAFDYDNDGWVDLVAVGETKDGKGEIRLFRNLGPDGWKDVTTDVGLDKIHLESPRAIITGDYDNDGATDLLITQNHGPAVLLRNEGATQNHWLKLSLKGLNDNKSAIGTKVEVFSGGNRQKFEIYGSNGYLGQNSTDLVVGLGQSKDADIVRMLWPTGVLQDEIDKDQVAGDKRHEMLEIDRRGSSCPTLFAWNGERYQFVADMLGAAVVGHWIGPNQRDIPRPVEYIKLPRGLVKTKPTADLGPRTSKAHDSGLPKVQGPRPDAGLLSFRFMEPLEEAVYLDQVRLMAVDHPADEDVYPNEYFASNPPYPEFKVVVSRHAQPPAGAWDEHGHNVLPDLLAHKFFGDFGLTQFAGFAKPHSLILDLGKPYDGGPLWLMAHGEIEYFTANSMYAASQAGLEPISPYVEALGQNGKWKRVMDDMGFPAGGPRTMTADLTGKLPKGTRQIRITTNLQIYWDSILVNRTEQVAPPSQRLSRGRLAPAWSKKEVVGITTGAEGGTPSGQPAGSGLYRLTPISLVRADLEFHGYPYKIEGLPPGNVQYIYEKTSSTGPYTRPVGTYTRYGDVLPLLTKLDDKLAVFGSGDEVRLDFDPSNLPQLPKGWVRDYFFAANGYEKDMDFYAAEGNYVAPLPFLSMGEYPYPPKKSFPLDDQHVNYLLEYNTRHMSGHEQRGYWFDYGPAQR
ncbi:MAG TPA: FG-GAP-like repeat-containing protein [Candidatus Sulfotelmatobacter sp.]|nr:FG-GAP-like repeat-containing protein [Candidatus Sulfotelmatobacter sp.]